MNPITLGNIPLTGAARTFVLAALSVTLAACGSPLFRSSSSSPAAETLASGFTGGRPTYTADEDAKKVVSVVMTSKFGYVRIERGEDGAPPNDQPITLTSAQISGMLGKLKFQKGTGKPEAIFADDDLKEISGPLATALAKAGPREDVTFAVTGKHGGVSAFLTRTATTGRVFYRNGQLNVIFGEIHGEFEDQFIATGYLRPFVTGSRTAKRSANWAVIPAEGAHYASAGRKDWIQVAESGVASAPIQERATGASSAPAPVPAPAPAQLAPHSDAYYQNIEKRLSVLKGLRDKGLITEEEYNEKRKAILKEL